MADPCFTPSSARRVLHRLRPAAEGICRLYRELERQRPRRIHPDQPVERAYFLLVHRLQAALGTIRSHGVRIPDLRSGRLEFPARRAGRPVMLCWRVGEPALRYWHDPAAGVEGRRPVDEDGPWEEG